MDEIKKLPVGMDDFEKLRRGGFYYVDKTGLMKELLDHWGEVNLFLRPRRFGKSLNMSMLRYFFEYGCDRELFDGLEIAQEEELCQKYMGKFPVICITLKGAYGRDYRTARAMLCSVVGNEAMRFQFLENSAKLSEREKDFYRKLTNIGKPGDSLFDMPDDVLSNSLRILSELLFKHYNQKVILLVDEYDVPLDKAQQFGYYDEMVGLLRIMFGEVLKTNPNLYFAVLTGCLRIAKESIFTGLNNLGVFSVTDPRYDEHFGFCDAEVRKMLEYYGVGGKYALAKAWYDGYHFGKTEVYCPWDVINYTSGLLADPEANPQAFWANTSGNDILRRFLQKATVGTKRELELLIDGGFVRKKINQDLTYRDLYRNIENLWSVLFMTGYLTWRGKADENYLELLIPNLEIRQIFVDQIMEWFGEEVKKDAPRLDVFCEAFLQADAALVEEKFNAYLKETISIRDTDTRKERKENFYHGILLGLLGHREDWWVYSNAESGDGYGDIFIEHEEKGIGIVIEVKYSEDRKLEEACQAALDQIVQKGYEARLRRSGMERVIRYGIACNRKKCKVKCE